MVDVGSGYASHVPGDTDRSLSEILLPETKGTDVAFGRLVTAEVEAEKRSFSTSGSGLLVRELIRTKRYFPKSSLVRIIVLAVAPVTDAQSGARVSAETSKRYSHLNHW